MNVSRYTFTKENVSVECIHYSFCGYFDLGNNTMAEEEKFNEYCVGCCCGDGAECNKHTGECYKCTNWEDGSGPIMG